MSSGSGWPAQADFEKRLAALHGISLSQVSQVAKIAVTEVKHFKFVVHSIEKHLMSRSLTRLQGVCVIDAILNRSNASLAGKDPFPKRFSKNIERTLNFLLDTNEKDKAKIIRIVKVWAADRNFPPETVRIIRDILSSHNVKSGPSGAASALLDTIDNIGKPGQVDHQGTAPARDPTPPPAPRPIIDEFDYGDEDDEDDEARLAEQAKRFEEVARRFEMEREAAARSTSEAKADVEGKASQEQPQPVAVAPVPPSFADNILANRCGIEPHPDQSHVPAGTVRITSCTLFIGSLRMGESSAQLQSMFSPFAKIHDIRMVEGGSAGVAFVRYENRADADTARDSIRRVFPQLKIGWGKGNGIHIQDFDQTSGIGFVSEDAIQQILAKPTDAGPLRPPSGPRRMHNDNMAPGHPAAARSGVLSAQQPPYPTRPQYGSYSRPPPTPPTFPPPHAMRQFPPPAPNAAYAGQGWTPAPPTRPEWLAGPPPPPPSRFMSPVAVSSRPSRFSPAAPDAPAPSPRRRSRFDTPPSTESRMSALDATAAAWLDNQFADTAPQESITRKRSGSNVVPYTQEASKKVKDQQAGARMPQGS